MDRPSQDTVESDIALESIRRKAKPTHLNIEEIQDPLIATTIPVSEDPILPESPSWRTRRRGEKDKTAKQDPKQERHKILFPRNRAKAFGHFLLFHAVAVGGAIALIVLNIKTRYYGTNGKWVSALQFVAKAHELLMQASIVTVMIAYLQYLLTQKRAVPFGAMFSAYQVGQMSYLWSPEFRATLTTSDFSGTVKTIFLLFVPLSILLAAGVGPSSAIAMQPRSVNMTVPIYLISLNLTENTLYPQFLDKAGPPLNVSSAQANDISVAAGWEYLQNLPIVGEDPTKEAASQQGLGEDTQTGLQTEYGESTQELVMPALYSTQFITYGILGFGEEQMATRTMYLQFAPNSTFATIQHIPVALALQTASLQFSENGATDTASIEMPQAYVSVVCELNSILNENDTRPIQFPNTYVAGCGGDQNFCDAPYGQGYLNTGGVTNYTAITRKQIWRQAMEDPQGRIIWVEGIKVSSPVPGTALGAIVVQPELCRTDHPFLTTSACVVGARWANTTSQLQETRDINSDSVGAIQNPLSPQSLSTLPLWSEPSLAISKAWAESLNTLTGVQNRTVADNLLRWMPVTDNICPTNGSYTTSEETLQFVPTRPFMHERLLASLIANGMSHAAGATQMWTPFSDTYSSHDWIKMGSEADDDNVHRNPPGIVLAFHCHLSGYAWSLDGIPIKLALAILLLYCVYTIPYVLYTFITGRSSMSWRSISELTALAINSTPTKELKRTSAGIKQTDTFRKLINVREVEENDRLELVFKEDEEKRGPYRRVAVGRGY